MPCAARFTPRTSLSRWDPDTSGDAAFFEATARLQWYYDNHDAGTEGYYHQYHVPSPPPTRHYVTVTPTHYRRVQRPSVDRSLFYTPPTVSPRFYTIFFGDDSAQRAREEREAQEVQRVHEISRSFVHLARMHFARMLYAQVSPTPTPEVKAPRVQKEDIPEAGPVSHMFDPKEEMVKREAEELRVFPTICVRHGKMPFGRLRKPLTPKHT